MPEDRQYCTFHVDGCFFGVPVERVQEVLRQQMLTRVPLAPREVSGLINLRGHIITTLDLRCRLGRPPRSVDEPAMNVLISSSEGPVSLLVDQIEDVLQVDPASVEPPPETLRAELRPLVRGVSKQKSRLLLLLDEEKAIQLGH